MSGKTVTPALGLNSFTCPHCGALAHQTWYKAYIDGYEKDSGPWIPNLAFLEKIKADREIEGRQSLVAFFERKLAKEVFTERHERACYSNTELVNLYVSHCYSCKAFALWVADRLIYPEMVFVIAPNEDMPPEIKLDFVEAASIVDQSPRGAAALLRLSIQKLLVHLGHKGKKLDDDIGALVKSGLDGRIQQALDVVRVIGNQAVHPGQIDLRDDKATAGKLFGLVNLIVEATISTPKHIEEMYGNLPGGALKAIEKRDGIQEVKQDVNEK